MTPPDTPNQILADYHDASRKIEAAMPMTDEERESFRPLFDAGRELVSRCILDDDPRKLIFLLTEIGILLQVIGQTNAAKRLNDTAEYLTDHYDEFGISS